LDRFNGEMGDTPSDIGSHGKKLSGVSLIDLRRTRLGAVETDLRLVRNDLDGLRIGEGSFIAALFTNPHI
jgi:hypothetical protein